MRNRGVIMFEKSDLTMRKLVAQRAEAIRLEHECVGLQQQYVRELVEDAVSLKGKWLVLRSYGWTGVYHCLDIRRVEIVQYKEERERPWNYFTDRIALVYDASGVKNAKGEFVCSKYTDRKVQNVLLADIRSAKAYSEAEILELYPQFRDAQVFTSGYPRR